MCPFETGVLFKPLGIPMGKEKHTSSTQPWQQGGGFQNDHGIEGMATHCSGPWDNHTSFINICKKLWYPRIHAALDGSWVIIRIKRTSGTMLFSPEVTERRL